jgi:hypothetical protein
MMEFPKFYDPEMATVLSEANLGKKDRSTAFAPYSERKEEHEWCEHD